MTPKPTREQETLYNLFTKYARDDGTIHDDGFKARVEALRASKSDILLSTYEIIEEFDDGEVNFNETPSLFNQFMHQYKFPSAMTDFIYNYVVNNEVDLTKLRTGIYLLDESKYLASGELEPEQNFMSYLKDQEYTKYINVTLAIPVDATSVQITKALTKYKNFIYERQEFARGSKRTYKRAHLLAERDTMLLNMSMQGMKSKDIARNITGKWKDSLTAPQISKILSRLNKNRQ